MLVHLASADKIMSPIDSFGDDNNSMQISFPEGLIGNLIFKNKVIIISLVRIFP
jgi:hypothetical protein